MGGPGVHAQRAAALYGYFLARGIESIPRTVVDEILSNAYGGLSIATNTLILRSGESLGYWQRKLRVDGRAGRLDIMPQENIVGNAMIEAGPPG